MFISSYNTYVSTENSQKVEKQRVETSKSSYSTFASKLSKNNILESNKTQDIPINYISNYKVFSNKQKLQEQFKNEDKIKYTKNKTIQNAKTAYNDNSKIFSLFLKPKTTQNQTLQIDKKLPNAMQELQEQHIRQIMLNTYIANENYYKITA